MDPYNETDRGRLFKAAAASYRKLEPFRVLAHNLIVEHAGSGYGHGDGERFETMINLMNQTVDAYTMILAANRPRVLVTTKYDQLKFFARKFETALNNLIEEIRIEETLARWVLDAFFGIGIIKVHLADSAPVQLKDGTLMDPGVPFASNISLDNFVFDSDATVWHKVQYAADWYRIPFDDLKSNLYDQDAVLKNQLQPTSKYTGNEERLERISIGREVDADEFRPMIDVADFWVPEDGMIYTWAIDSSTPFLGKGDPIAKMEWTGPEFGPYHVLGFGDVPENIMPVSPASHLSALAKLANNLLRKGSRQARRQKDVTVYTPTGAAAAKKIKASADGEWVEAQDPSEIKQFKSGGVDPGNHAFLLGIVQMFDRMAGNLTAMLGLGAQSDTVGQESLIHGAVSTKEAKMQLKVIAGTVRLLRDLGWMHWQDAVKVQPASIPIPNAPGYQVDATWRPGDRNGQFLDYNVGIDVFSMRYQSPAERIQGLTGVLQQVFIPLADMLAQQGGQINLQQVAETYAKYGNWPELNDWIQFVNMPTTDDQQDGPSPPSDTQGPTQTTRNYIRKTVPSQNPSTSVPQEANFWMQKAMYQGQKPGLGQMSPM